MSRKHDAIYSDPTGAAAAASPAKRRTPRAKGSSAAGSPVSERETIANLAYSYWQARGYTGGSAEEDWLRAEREVRKGRAASAVL
jgi:hypothetical protein